MDSPDNKKRIGDYELLSVLGSGSQGQVYKARCVVSGKEFVQEGEVVAIKILGRSGNTTAAEDARFKREARILESLQHPSICRYIDYFIEGEGEFDERQCLVTEFLDGEALDDRLTRYPKGLPWDEVFPIFEQCIEGLVYAAERDVFHRDLKPSNIYITRDGHAKIIDFGIARQEGGEETTSGGFKGSFDYMSPDFVLVDGFRGDMRSDIFSLGVCFYKALTGELPFEALGDNAHIGYLNRWKSTEAARPSFRHNAFRVLTRAKPFVTDALAADPEERFHTFQEMLEGLRQIKRRVIRHKGKEDYELLDVLGRGGFGEVYKGRMASNGGLVAIKHLFAGRQASRFVKEAKLLQQYHHPDIVEYVDFIEVEGLGDDKEFFLVMEYLPGMPGAGLNQRIRRSRFGMEPAEVVEIFIHYLSALQFLHENPRPIIHRDIKPGNLYAPVGQPHKAKLFDLGVARDVSGTMTTGMIPGTLDYMAPEFARPGSERGTPQSDIYAMGVTLYESLTGNKPFPRLPKSDQEAFVQFVARAQNPPPVNYGMPVFREISKLEQVLRQSLAVEPDDRYGSAGRMLADLEALLEEVSAEAVDQHDAPTRATIADPALMERLRAHQQQRPDRIPESEMRRILDESSSKGDVQQRPDWLMEEGSESQYAAPPPTASPTPSPVQAAAPRNTGLKIAAVAALAAALGLGGFMMWRNMPKSGEEIREEFVDARSLLAAPEPTEAYVIRLLSMQAQARERKLEDDTTYAVLWDNEITTISEYGRKVPEAFDQAFRQAIADGDLATAEEVRNAWRSVGDAVSFMGLTQREYLEQSDAMRDQIAQFNFTEEVKGLRARLPERISGATDVAAAESVAVGLRSLRSQPWEEVPAEDRDAVFEDIESRLTELVSNFVTARKEEVLARYGEGLDAGTEADALADLEQSAPTLAALADETYRTALAEVADARGRHERMQAVAATLDRLNNAVPASIRTPGDVVRAEAAVAAYQQEQLADWPGIDPEDKRASLDRVRSNLVARIETYIEDLRSTAVQKYGDLVEEVPEAEALQQIGGDAPKLVALLDGVYADAVQHVEDARADRDATLVARREEAAAAEAMAQEQARLEAERRAAEERQAEMAANREAFRDEVQRLSGLAPAAIDDADDLAAAEAAARGVDAFAGRDWPDVDAETRDAAAAELRADLAAMATAYVEGLSRRAVEGFDAGEATVPAWVSLGRARDDAPSIVALIDSAYDQSLLTAEQAMRRQQGMNEFTVALDRIRDRIPNRIDSPDALGEAEQAAVDLRQVQGQSWDMVSPEQRSAGLDQAADTLRRRAAAYLTDLRDQALDRYRNQQDASAVRETLAAAPTLAPTLSGMLGDLPAEALAAVDQAGEAMAQRLAYTEMLAGIDAEIPESLDGSADLAAAERALQAHRQAAARNWAGIPDAEQQAALDQRAEQLRTLAESYVSQWRQQALDAYRDQRDGQQAAERLAALESEAPTLTAAVQDAYAAAASEVAAARGAWEASSRFVEARRRILDAIPAAPSDSEDMAQLEKAAAAFDQLQSAPWADVPAADKVRTFQEIRNRLTAAGNQYITSLVETAVSQYRELEDAAAPRDELRGYSTEAPTLVALMGGSYAEAVQTVDAARDQRLSRLEAIEEERLRQEELRQERERLAALRTEEEERLTAAQTAWDQVQSAWASGQEADLDAANEAILTPTFQIEELAATHATLKQTFLDSLQDRVSGYLQRAEGAIAAYRAYTYQIQDPTFSGSYRVVEQDPPAIRFDLPVLNDGGENSLGLSRAAVLRLQSWKEFAANPGDPAASRSLADRLATIAAASRQDGDLELANQCRMESALLLSEPAVFPRALEETGEPLEIFRWRAHANYQPEAADQQNLMDMERYAKGGDMNEFDLRLAIFSAYYCFRNSIDGEGPYVQRTGKYLSAILAEADADVSTSVMNWLIAYIESGTDSESEYPGLYMMTALSSIGSESAAARQAAEWLNANRSTYDRRFEQMQVQINLLQRLLRG